MKAILLRRPGGPEALEYVEVPTPVPGEGKVLVKADTIGVSMPEVLVRRGTYAWMPSLPAIPGIELADRRRARPQQRRAGARPAGFRQRPRPAGPRRLLCRIRPLVHDRLPLAEAGRAEALLESGQVIGKLLLKP